MFTRKTIVFTQLIRICDLVRTYLRELHKIPPLIVNLGYQLWKGNHDFFLFMFWSNGIKSTFRRSLVRKINYNLWWNPHDQHGTNGNHQTGTWTKKKSLLFYIFIAAIVVLSSLKRQEVTCPTHHGRRPLWSRTVPQQLLTCASNRQTSLQKSIRSSHFRTCHQSWVIQ